jgi:hypothetical protein
MDKKNKAPTTKKLITSFWELSRPRQEAFLKELLTYDKETKWLSYVFLAKRSDIVLEKLLADITKITTRDFRRTYQKLRIKKINDVLRAGDKCCLSIHEQMKLLHGAWSGMLLFIRSDHYCPERYEVSAVKLLQKHIDSVKNQILEPAESEVQLQQIKVQLQAIFDSSSRYMFYAQETYRANFG